MIVVVSTLQARDDSMYPLSQNNILFLISWLYNFEYII